MPIEDLARRIIAMTGSRSEIVNHPLPQDDPVRRKADTRKARAELGWEPTVPLETGLERTIAYFREIIARYPESVA